MLEIDLSMDESSDEPRVYALELLSAKLKRQIRSKKSFILFRVTAQIFQPIKAKESPPFDLHHAVEREKHRAARINEATFHLPRTPGTCLGQIKSLGNR